MYHNIRQKFSLSDAQIAELLQYGDDNKDLFQDYESVLLQNVKDNSDPKLNSLCHELLEELEDEIARVIMKHESLNR